MENTGIGGRWKMRNRIDERGSLTLEAAMEICLFSMVCFSLLSIMQYIYLYAVTFNVAAETAEKISAYSCVFFRSGLGNLSDSVKTKAIAAVRSKDGDFDVIAELAEVSIEKVGSAAWGAAAKSIAENILDKEVKEKGKNIFNIRITSVLGSEFFEKGNRFTVVLTAESPFVFPWPESGKSCFQVSVRVSGNAWLYGAFSGYNVSDINVWSLDNFKRGRVLEEIFNGNMPDKFPTVDIFDEKSRTVTMIVSLDTTSQTNRNSKKLYENIVNEAKKLQAFTEAKCDGVTILKSDYDTKRMLLVFPDNRQTEEQMEAVTEASMRVGMMGIVMETVNYQTSQRYT